jgi:hypothetical protein
MPLLKPGAIPCNDDSGSHIQPGFSTDLAKQLGDVIDRLLREPTPED